LEVRHAGYPDGRCDDLRIVARSDPSGERALARHRLLVRARPRGIEVAARMESDTRPVVELDNLTLGFELRATGSAFAANTDLSAWAGPGTPRHAVRKGSLELVDRSPHSPAPGVLALIDIDVRSAYLSAPPTFTLELASRETLWAFYLLTKRTQNEAPRIEDSHRTDPLAFTGKRLTAATTPASADPIGARLLERNPDHRCHRFVSKRPVAWQQAARRQLSLYLGDELLIRELDTPSAQSSTILALARAKPRETLYRVVVY
jgi:hypothetical protein